MKKRLRFVFNSSASLFCCTCLPLFSHRIKRELLPYLSAATYLLHANNIKTFSQQRNYYVASVIVFLYSQHYLIYVDDTPFYMGHGKLYELSCFERMKLFSHIQNFFYSLHKAIKYIEKHQNLTFVRYTIYIYYCFVVPHQ